MGCVTLSASLFNKYNQITYSYESDFCSKQYAVYAEL